MGNNRAIRHLRTERERAKRALALSMQAAQELDLLDGERVERVEVQKQEIEVDFDLLNHGRA
eukprot:5678473-Heterocapsa_arctica.AAC.1